MISFELKAAVQALESRNVKVYLVTGVKLEGKIYEAYEDYFTMESTSPTPQLVIMQNVVTIQPVDSV